MAKISINTVTLGGNLTKDPELKFTASGKAVCRLSMAVNRPARKGSDKSGADFFNITAWEKSGEACAQHLKKGSAIVVEGVLRYESWKDKEGNMKSKTGVVARVVHFVDSEPAAEPVPREQQAPKPAAQVDLATSGDDNLPF